MKNLKGIEFLTAPGIEMTGLVVHAFLTRLGGVSPGVFSSLNFSEKGGDSKENVGKNCEILAETFNIDPTRLFTVNQVHGDRVLVIKENPGRFFQANKSDYDAIITNRRGIVVGVLTADCLPIMILDPRKKVVGIVHAGWRGTSLKIVLKTVMEIAGTFESLPQDLLVGLGPAIGDCCYEVDRSVKSHFDTYQAGVRHFMNSGKKQKWLLNLGLLNREQLLEAGILKKNIYFVDICTSCNDNLFFSHRRDAGNTGRQLSFIGLKFDCR